MFMFSFILIVLLFLQLDVDYLKCDDFLVADLRVDQQRHMVFATEFQLNMLKHASRWFMDGTFKVLHIYFIYLCKCQK